MINELALLVWPLMAGVAAALVVIAICIVAAGFYTAFKEENR